MILVMFSDFFILTEIMCFLQGNSEIIAQTLQHKEMTYQSNLAYFFLSGLIMINDFICVDE